MVTIRNPAAAIFRPKGCAARNLGRARLGKPTQAIYSALVRVSPLTGTNMADKKPKQKRSKNKKDNPRKNKVMPSSKPKNKEDNIKANTPAVSKGQLQITFTRMTRSKGVDATFHDVNTDNSKRKQCHLDSPTHNTDECGDKETCKRKKQDTSLVEDSLSATGNNSELTSQAGSHFTPAAQQQTHTRAPSQGDQSKGATASVQNSSINQGKISDSDNTEAHNTSGGSYNEQMDSSHHEQQKEGVDLLQSLAIINKKLQKLDALDSITIALKEGMSGVQSKVDGVLAQMGSVKNDLLRCEEKWEAGANALAERITKLERSSQGMNNKWDSFRAKVQKDVSIKQSGIDSNSSKILDLEAKVAELQERESQANSNSEKIRELEAQVTHYREKWEALESTEKNIKEAAEDKFKLIQVSLKEEIHKELNKGVPKPQIQTQAEAPQASQYAKLKDQAHRNRHNIILFGLYDNNDVEADLKDVVTFFKDRMGLLNMAIENTYRLGPYGNTNSDRPRPLVVTFSDIKDRWAMWNRRGKIKYVQDVPIWLHEDLPKKLRTDNRILQRIAKMARTKQDIYGEVKVKDYRIHLNGQEYDMDSLHLLPKELTPHAVYSPRSETALVFFTKNSPFSNHFPSDFKLDGLSLSCVEQYLAVQRAYLAKDKPLARRAMQQKDPAEHKMVLNKLRNQDRDEWRRLAPDLIRKAIRAKFTQNTLLKDLLLSTHPLQLGEASKDPFWGVGFSLEHPNVLDTDQWIPEGNLLGKTLMSIREELLTSAGPHA